MTFAEFQIRLFAYKRMELREWEKVRQIAWSSFIAPHQDPKKMPKSIDRFMSLGDNNTRKEVGIDQKENFLKAYKEYLNHKNNGIRNTNRS
jgi:hypothetical protein